MRQSMGQRMLLMVYTAVWLVLLMAVYWVLVEQTSGKIERMYSGMSLPKITRHVALPLIGGLRPTKGFNALPYLVWGGLFVWPMINVIFTIAAAYPLSRKDLAGRSIIMFLFTFTLIFGGGLIPTYLLVRNVGILNTRWALLIPQAMHVFNVIIARTFFQQNVPQEMLDAAKIDGASDIQFIVKVVLPLSGAIVAVITLFYAVFHWNSFFDAFIYLSSRKLYPLQVFLREILVMNEIDADLFVDPKEMQAMQDLRELLKYALIIVSSLPIILMYPFVQKYFVRGVMLGSIKG